MKHWLAAAFAATALCAAAPAYADGHTKGQCFDKGSMKYYACGASKEWYLTGFAGYAWPDNLESDGSILGGLVTGTSDRELDGGFVGGGGIGAYLYKEKLRGELELAYQSFDVNNTTLSNGAILGVAIPGALTVDLDGEVEALTLMMNLWYDFDTGSGFTPYVGGGVGVGFVDLNTTVTALPILGAVGDSTSFAFQVGAGVDYAVSDMIDIGIGYRFRGITDIDAEGRLLGGIVRYEDASLYSHGVQAQVRINFYDD